MKSLPCAKVVLNGRELLGLVDTGCTTYMMRTNALNTWYGKSSTIAFDGSTVQCLGQSRVKVLVDGESVEATVMVVKNVVANFEIVIGMDVIRMLGGVTVADGTIKFGSQSEPNCPKEIEDKDFSATFDGNP